MMRPSIAAAAIIAILFVPPCFAQSATPEGVADEFAQAWSTHDKAAFERIFVEDARFIPTYDIVGEGRTNVVAGIYEAHEASGRGGGWARDTTLTTSKVAVQQLRPDVAVVHFNVSVHALPGRNLPPLARTLLLVVVKQEDGWRIAAGQLTKPNCPPG